jgi:hypothetical protein
MPLSDAQRRTARTFLQVGLVQAGIAVFNAFHAPPLTIEQSGAITLFLTPFVVFAQNWLEDNTSAPAVLKAPASPGVNPTPEPERLLEQHPQPTTVDHPPTGGPST